MAPTARPVLVTGASGFVGSAVARALLAQGRAVRVLLRPGSDRRNIADLGVEIRIGALEDKGSLAAALAGCAALFHVAADYRLWVRDPAAMYRANVDGTRALMEAALAAGVERIVYTSSVAMLGLQADGSAADETTPSVLDDMIGAYKRSKFLAEEAVRDLVRGKGLPAVIVNPSTPIGPRDVKPTPTGRMIVEAASGTHAGLRRHRAQPRPCRRCRRRAISWPRSAAASASATSSAARIRRWREILADIARLAGRQPPRLALPIAPLWPLALAAEAVARRHRHASLSSPATPCAWRGTRCSSPRPRRCASSVMRARPVDEALADAVAWFRAAGMCRDAPSALAAPAARGLALSAARPRLLLAGARARRRGSRPAAGGRWPGVAAVVPARDEAEVVGARDRLAAGPGLSRRIPRHPGRRPQQRRHGRGRRAAPPRAARGRRLRSSPARPLPAGLDRQAVGAAARASQRRAARRARSICCSPTPTSPMRPTICAAGGARRGRSGCDLVSLMAKLRCVSRAERFLIPAFVFFFAMLYPFAWVNDPQRAHGGGGRRLHAGAARGAARPAGGIAAIRGALIDDCALARGGEARRAPIWLGLTERARSLRPYPRIADIWPDGGAHRLRPARLFAAAAGRHGGRHGADLSAAAARWRCSRGGPGALAGLAAWALMALAYPADAALLSPLAAVGPGPAG